MQWTIEELRAIAAERREWAKQARDKDLHGSAKEWELTADLAIALIKLSNGEHPNA